jgi:hypothetical protein
MQNPVIKCAALAAIDKSDLGHAGEGPHKRLPPLLPPVEGALEDRVQEGLAAAGGQATGPCGNVELMLL